MINSIVQFFAQDYHYLVYLFTAIVLAYLLARCNAGIIGSVLVTGFFYLISLVVIPLLVDLIGTGIVLFIILMLGIYYLVDWYTHRGGMIFDELY